MHKENERSSLCIKMQEKGWLNEMGKKKDKKKSALKDQKEFIDFREMQKLNPLRPSTDETYESLLDEIAYYQYQLYKEDQKLLKKRKKKALKTGTPVFLTSRKQLETRTKVIKKIGKQGGLLDRIIAYLKKATPFIKEIGRVCGTLICTLLNIDAVKKHISAGMLEKVNFVYQVCMNL